MTSETELAWVAGFFDGDGSVSAHRGGRYRTCGILECCITNSDTRILDRIERLSYGWTRRTIHEERSGRRRTWATRLYRMSRMKAFLQAIHPYLTGKAEQALLAIGFCSLSRKLHPLTEETRNLRLAMVGAIQALNKGVRLP